ncbi:4Fe-4S dicluster domain-containing protein [Calderihabitans maritimus]|uniref:Heterodisulfide reductase, subunit C n=1 Tax=Calderihabitans maritimus TaxID=1246530 RepID=A0A1Z5HTX6_9FIRM|nr:4Fe-4S dicluster domain-containing protein [Calderihabitans maritimus]GAW92989.1 heterodisulfide reductase, subunit C [Calderihabitans maritimus]
MEKLQLNETLKNGNSFREYIQKHSNVDPSSCYQCGKCTAGCPVSFAMDYTPRQVMRMIQLGMEQEALSSHTIWLCACCETCSVRCPKNIDLAKVMETLRIEAKRRGMVAERNIDLFADLFLNSVEKYGRVHEMGLILQYNLKTGQFFKDANLAPTLFKNSKIHLQADKIQDGGAVKRIFQRVKTQGGEG